MSTFLWRDTATRASLPVQIAIVSALLGLLSLDFEQIIKTNKEYSTIASQSIPAADHIKKWFSSLSNKNQALSFSLLQCPDFATKPWIYNSRTVCISTFWVPSILKWDGCLYWSYVYYELWSKLKILMDSTIKNRVASRKLWFWITREILKKSWWSLLCFIPLK